ncbi:MAG: AbrB/MazE/SpoVT family DNA-binding domain-containing protein [Chloroflexota bacterium]|nr:MAG: AbrB/MazE/SpoVT family DNA-binding domain-containing protein [Chloroflexota bacterium]
MARLGEGGRLVIPADMRRAMGVESGDVLLLSLDEIGLRVMTRNHALARAQEMMRALVPANVSLTDELIADRRREAANE